MMKISNFFNCKIFKERRKSLALSLPQGSALLLFSHPRQTRTNAIYQPYRQDSDLFYLTGFDKKEAIFLFRPHFDPESILFVPPKDSVTETWEGLRESPDEAKKKYGMNHVFTTKDFKNVAPELLKAIDKIYCKLFFDHEIDLRLKDLFLRLKALKGRNEKSIPVIDDATSLIGEMRLFKSPIEIECIKKAVQISVEAHKALMKATYPSQNERTLHGLFKKEIMARGAKREAYESIIASGENATIMHYISNHKQLKKGELLLVDAGAEFNYYASDISRTYPVSGSFSVSQKRVYEKLLFIQKSLINAVAPGLSFSDLQMKTIHLLVDLMIDENLLKGKRDDLVSSFLYKKHYPHGVGHWLGLDVHDTGLIKKDGKARALKENMCLTIEPGLYIPRETPNIDKDLKGTGFRIEDDILVTKNGRENLSQNCPKDVKDLEALIGHS